MAKNKKNAPKKAAVRNALPQNILQIGDSVEENKKIYISQPVYKQIHTFTKNKIVNESGGMLIGSVIEAFGKTNVIIKGFVEAKYCQGTPTTLTFSHETWNYVHKTIDKKFPGEKIVGWIHTHPNFGVFLSEYDKFIQENFFKEDYQIAYVIDPIQKSEGFYFWNNGVITRCKGYYKFDKMGAKIADEEKVSKTAPVSTKSKYDFKWIVIILLILCVIGLLISNLYQMRMIQNLNYRLEQYQNEVFVYEISPGDFGYPQQQPQTDNTSETTEEQMVALNPEGE